MAFALSLLISVLPLIKSSFSSTYHRTTMTSSTNTLHIQTSSAAPAAPATSTAASQRGGGDPCVPASNLDFGSALNTCYKINTTDTDAPSVYGVQCLNVNPSWNQSINLTSCVTNIVNICGRFIASTVTVSQWNWSSGVCMMIFFFFIFFIFFIFIFTFIFLRAIIPASIFKNETLTCIENKGPNCTVGVWSNPPPAAQPFVSWNTCVNDIYLLMQSTCFSFEEGQFNVAAVNLQTLPDEVSNGSQVDPGYPSYIIVPETYDDIYTDETSEGIGGDDGDAGGD